MSSLNANTERKWRIWRRFSLYIRRILGRGNNQICDSEDSLSRNSRHTDFYDWKGVSEDGSPVEGRNRPVLNSIGQALYSRSHPDRGSLPGAQPVREHPVEQILKPNCGPAWRKPQGYQYR